MTESGRRRIAAPVAETSVDMCRRFTSHAGPRALDDCQVLVQAKFEYVQSLVWFLGCEMAPPAGRLDPLQARLDGGFVFVERSRISLLTPE